MKNFSLMIFVGLLWPSVAFAEGGGDPDWAENAAVQYEKKAAEAVSRGNAHDAGIYLRLAQIKRDAGAAAKAGKDFNWDEYHALCGKLGGAEKDNSGKKVDPGEKIVKGNPGDGFISTAQEFLKKSIEAAKAGDTEKAVIYGELARIKMEAATAANQGKDFDWTRYEELTKKLAK